MARLDRNFTALKSEPAMERETVIHAGNVVREFLLYLKANPITEARIIALDDLPLPKGSLINAFRLLIAAETRPEQRAQLQKVGLLLAQFQPVDSAPQPAQASDDADDPLASWIDDVTDEPASERRSWLAAYREQERLTELFNLSAQMAERQEEAEDAEDAVTSTDGAAH